MFPKMRISILLALKAVTILGDKNTKTPDDIDCTNYLFDQCDLPSYDTPGVEDIIHNMTGMDNCKFFCESIFADKCTFFVSHLRRNTCEIWTIDPEDYETRCALRAGPVGKTGDLAKCKDDRKDCNVSFDFPQLMIFIQVAFI